MIVLWLQARTLATPIHAPTAGFVRTSLIRMAILIRTPTGLSMLSHATAPTPDSLAEPAPHRK